MKDEKARQFFLFELAVFLIEIHVTAFRSDQCTCIIHCSISTVFRHTRPPRELDIQDGSNEIGIGSIAG
jgi:hypothetical protein